MKYTNYTNMDARFMRGYKPGDRLVRGWQGVIDKEDGELTTMVLERLFSRHNRDDRPDGQLCPSMSVGDVVKLEDDRGYHSWHTVESIGFEAVDVDATDLITDRTWREVDY